METSPSGRIKQRAIVAGVPVNWKEVPDSKVSLLKDSMRMFSGIFRIRQRCGTATKRRALADSVLHEGYLAGASRHQLRSDSDA
jgi:hypothetical protein